MLSNTDSCNILEYLEEIKKRVEIDERGTPRVPDDARDHLEKFKLCVVIETLGTQLSEAIAWLSHVNQAVENLKQKLKLAGFTYPREFNSFISDPIEHLKKKLFNYVMTLIRGRLSLDEFQKRAAAAIRTSFRTNLRSAYQIWGLTTIMSMLADRGYEVEYPEHRFLNFDRSGKQKLGIIPPNAVLFNIGRGFISIFHEAPRPLSWEDTSDLQKIWRLYTALRPDAMIYGGKVMNIVDLSNNPPIKRPDVILEFKELEDWYARVRDLRGYFKKPLTAEEWYSKWRNGLFEGLADILDLRKSDVRKRIEEGASLRVREYQLVKLYYSTYRPRTMVLVSRTRVPREIVTELENSGIVVVDNVGFEPRNLEPVVEILDSIASFEGGECVSVPLSSDTAKLLAYVMEILRERNAENVIRKALASLLETLQSAKAVH